MKKIFLLLLIAFVLFVGCAPSSSSGGDKVAYIPIIAGVSAGSADRAVSPPKAARSMLNARNATGEYGNITVTVYWPDGYSDTTGDLARSATPIITGWEASGGAVESGEVLTYQTTKFGVVTVTVTVDEETGVVTYHGTFAGSDSYFDIGLDPATNAFTFDQRLVYDLVFIGEMGNRCLVNQWLSIASITGAVTAVGFDAAGYVDLCIATSSYVSDPAPTLTTFQYWEYEVKSREGFYGVLFRQYSGSSPAITYEPMYLEDADELVSYCNMNKAGSPLEEALLYSLGGDVWTGAWSSYQANEIWNAH